MTWGHSLVLDENLRLDYNHLDSRVCFCGGLKEMGELMCERCEKAIPPAERTRLHALKPGQGMVAEAKIAHARLLRRGRRG